MLNLLLILSVIHEYEHKLEHQRVPKSFNLPCGSFVQFLK